MLEWHGEEIKDRIRHGARRAINSVLADCVGTAKSIVAINTTALQGGIQMRAAEIDGDRVSGLWGVWQIAYALTVEEGSVPHKIFPNRKKALSWPGLPHPIAMVNHPGTEPQPYLRPSAKKHYPSLPARIRQEWQT